MTFTFRCPSCSHVFQIHHTDLGDGKAMRCRQCGDTPAPDIMTAYANVGKTLTELYGCCQAGRQEWLPQKNE